ncbi:MAG: ATP-binding protein [Campylobacterota bacterium]|nr:ATP-binding protein [Campylobacterota bacterium]
MFKLYKKLLNLKLHSFNLSIILFEFSIVALLSYEIFSLNIPQSELKYIFFILLLFVVGNLFILKLLKEKIEKPIKYLSNMIENFKDLNVGKTEKIFYYDEIGDMTNEFFILQNILQRKTSDIKKSKQELESATNALSDSIYYKNLSLNYTWVNDSFCKLMNLPRTDILGKNDFDLFEEEISIKSTFVESQLMENGKDIYFESTTTSPYGKTIYLASKKYLLKDNNNKAYAIAGMISDITLQKETEMEIFKQKNFIQKLIDSQEQLIITMNNHTLNSVNETFLDFFAVDSIENFKKEYNSTCISSTFKKDVPNGYLQEKMDNIKWIDYIGSNSSDKVIISREGHDFIFSISVTTLPQKESLKLVVFTDITELETAKEKAIEAETISQKANQSKSEFLANMSHEIRTPMNAIIGFSELLHEQVEDKHLKQFTKTIQSAGHTLLELINDILDLSKIEAGKLNITQVPTNIYHLIEETTNIFALKLEEKGLDLLLDIDRSIPQTIIIDEIRIRQILLNLIGNAIKFTPSGSIKVILKPITTDEMKSTVDFSISVKDTGIGIKENQLEKIFHSFEQHDGQDTKEYGGTGLGLSISNKLAKMMDGEITVESQYSKGSTFTLTLHHISISSIVVEKEQKSTLKHYKFKQATLLLVDDIKNNRELVKQNFKDSKIKIITAYNGQVAVDIAKKQKIDIVLMDIRMPIMDGYQAATIIKKLKPDTPIIALTASVMENEFQKIKSNNFNGYLRKPILRRELFEELAKYLEYDEEIETIIQEEEKIVLSSKTEKNRKLIIDTLNNNINILFEKVQKSNNINDTKHFATTLLELSHNYEIEYLKQYAESLIVAIDSFDIMEIKKLLGEYKDQIDKLI